MTLEYVQTPNVDKTQYEIMLAPMLIKRCAIFSTGIDVVLASSKKNMVKGFSWLKVRDFTYSSISLSASLLKLFGVSSCTRSKMKESSSVTFFF